jgi:hypothetical protein
VLHLKRTLRASSQNRYANMDDPEIAAVNNDDDEESRPPPQADPDKGQTSRPPSRGASGASRSRLRWLPLSVVTVDESGESKVTHPFLRNGNKNWMDQMLIRQLLVDQPFAAPFGKSGQAWKTCAEDVNKAQDPEGNLVFGSQGVSDKAIKKRFDELMAFVKANDDSIPFQSGCDDEPGPNNLGTAMEDLYEVYTSVLSETKMASASNAAKKSDDATRAEALRNASLGCLSPSDKDYIKSYQTKKGNKNSTICSTPSSSSSNNDTGSGSAKKLKVEHHSSFDDSMAVATARLQKRQEIVEAKEERRKEMQEHKIKHQDREFRFKKEQAEKEDVRNERADRIQEMQLRLQSDMLQFFGSAMKKKNDTNETE